MPCGTNKLVCGTFTDDCLVKLKSKCIIYDGPSTSNIGYVTNMPLTDLLLLIDQAVGTGGGLVSVSTVNSPSIAFTGNGTPGNPLSATVIGTLIPTLAQVTAQGNITPSSMIINASVNGQFEVIGGALANIVTNVGSSSIIMQSEASKNIITFSGTNNAIDVAGSGVLNITTASGTTIYNTFAQGQVTGEPATAGNQFTTLDQLEGLSSTLTLAQVTDNGNSTPEDILIYGTGATEASQLQIGNTLTSSVTTLQAGYNPGVDEGVSALLLQGEDRNQIIFSPNDLELLLDDSTPVITVHTDGKVTGTPGTNPNHFITYSQLPTGGDFVENQNVAPQAASYYVNQPSKIEYLTDTDGNTFGALEVYRTILNPDAKAPQSIRSVLRVSSDEVGHEDKELTSVYGGLHITAANTGNYTNATEGLIAVAGTASTLGGSGNITLMSCFGALGGNAPTGPAIIDRFAFFKVTSYDQNLNTGKVTKIAGFAQPKLSIPGATGAIQWFSGMGDATTSGGMLGNQVWPTGNWNMYDASGYNNYISGPILASTLTDDTTSKLQVGGTIRTPKVVGGTVIGDTLSLQNYTSGTTGAVIDQYGITVGGGAASTNTLFKATRAFTNPTGNVHGFRAEHSVIATGSPTATALFGGFFVPTIGAGNNQNWTTPVSVQGISVAPTITNGATGTISAIVAGTFDLNLRAPGTTVTNAVGVRVYIDPLATSAMTNVCLLSVGVEGIISGNWGIYNASPYPSYLGSNNILINTTTDSGSGAKLQVAGAVEATQGSFTGATLPQLRCAFDATFGMNVNVNNTEAVFTTTGSGMSFRFSQRVNLIAGFATNTSSTNSSNIQVPAAVTNTSDARFIVGGGASTMFRAAFSGLSTDIAPLNSDITNVIIPRNNVTTQPVAIHPTMSALLVMPPTLVSGQAPAIGASLIVESGTTTAVDNYALYVMSGSTRLGGGIQLPIRAVTATASMTSNDYTLIVNNGAVDATITLPPHRVGAIYNVKRTSTTNDVTVITPTGLIDGIASYIITVANQSVTFQSDGTNYNII